MTNAQRAALMMHTSAQLDYWTPKMSRGEGLEAEDQFLHYTKLMKFLVTEMDNDKTTVIQQGPNVVFPSL